MRSGISIGVEQSLGSGAFEPKSAPITESAAEEKPDVNEIIKSSTTFTNSIGMVLKKTGSGLWVSAYETTQTEFQEVMRSNPSAFSGGKRPVDSVSWQAATRFCSKLTEHEKGQEMLPDGYHYVLPTQAQWARLAGGVSLANAVTGSGTRRSSTAQVGSLSPSGDGLYDLRGNVAEWCADPADGAFRVLRGGSWADWVEVNLRPEFRIYAAPSEAKNTYGFRCVLTKGR